MPETTVDVTKAPAKILSVTELKNGKILLVTEAKVYEYLSGKLHPVTFADVEYEAVAARSKASAVGAVPAAAPPPAPPVEEKTSTGKIAPNDPLFAPKPTGDFEARQ